MERAPIPDVTGLVRTHIVSSGPVQFLVLYRDEEEAPVCASFPIVSKLGKVASLGYLTGNLGQQGVRSFL